MKRAYDLLMELWHHVNRTWASTNLGSYLATAWLELAQEAMSKTSMREWESTSPLFESIKHIVGMIVDRTQIELNIEDRTAPRTVHCQSNEPQAAQSYGLQLDEIMHHIQNCQSWSTQAHEWMLKNEWLRQIHLDSPFPSTPPRCKTICEEREFEMVCTSSLALW